MTKRLAYSHDQFFRDTFSNQGTALDFLQNYLPARIKALVDLSTLEIKKDTFIDPELQPSYADLLYHLQWTQNIKDEGFSGEGGLFLYLLFEHKSYPDPWVALQLLDYQNRIWNLWRKQQRKEKKEEADKTPLKAKLPPILPFVFYHGQNKWQVGLSFQDLIALPVELKPYVVQFYYQVYDLSAWSDAQIIGQVYLRARLLLMKYILREELLDKGLDEVKVEEIFGMLWALAEAETGMEHIQVMMQYLVSGMKGEEKEVLIEKLQKTHQGVKMMTTIAEAWFEEGKIEGKVEGLCKSLRRIFAHLFEIELDHFDQELQCLDVETLEHLNEIVFELESLVELEALLISLQPVSEKGGIECQRTALVDEAG